MLFDAACQQIRNAARRTPIVLAATGLASFLAIGPALAGSTSTLLSGPGAATVFGEAVDFDAAVYGLSPSGTATFKDGATELGTGSVEPVNLQASIAVGSDHGCILSGPGAVYCWGDNGNGQLGDNSTDNRTAPVPVSGLSSGVVGLAAGGSHTCALTHAGAVLCWGRNVEGQLGDGTNDERHTPVAVNGLSEGVSAISTHSNHTCALTDAGAVKCWGSNISGQIGDGSTDNRNVPVAVTGLASGVAAIAAGGGHSCALMEAGTVQCWGQNDFGELGDGTWDAHRTPAPVISLPAGVVDVLTGGGHSCARTGGGTLYCWGKNGNGQVGDGFSDDINTPAMIFSLPDVVGVSAGYRHTCAVNGSGAAYCWGENSDGQLGDTTTTERLDPMPVSTLASGVAFVRAGGFANSCAVLKTGAVKCWGYNSIGQVGDGTSGNTRTAPVDVSGFGPGMATIPAIVTFSTDELPAGSHSITARYGGDGSNSASTSTTVTHVVGKADTETKIKVKPKKPKAGKSASIKITIAAVAPASGKPDGKVTVKDGRKKLGKFKVKNGKAKIKLRDLKAGKHKLKAKYPGDKNWNKSKVAAKLNVRN